MIESMPAYVPALFILTTAATAGLLYLSAIKGHARSQKRFVLLAVISVWLLLQAVLALSGFYADVKALPPRIFVLGALPALLSAAVIALVPKLDRSALGILTLLHVVRVPVEITLYLLYQHHLVPASMTFEGRNFDILSGLTAPFIYYFAARRTNFSRPILIVWNIAALALLVNIVATAILAFPSPLQTIAFDQPNRAIIYFPYVWLPSFVVPAVLYAHLAALRILFAPTPGTAAH